MNFETEGAVLIAKMVGPNIGQRESEIIVQAFKAALENDLDSAHLLIDMSEVNFMNSMGIGMLVDLRSQAAAKNMNLVMGGVKPDLENLLKMVRLDKLFTICTNDKQLAKALKKR